MRRAVIILVLGFIFLGCMSLKPLPDAQQRIFDFDMDKDALFIATNEWLAQTINDARVAIEFRDKDGGKIVGDVNVYYISDMTKLVRHRVWINFNFTIKNKKARLVMQATGTIHDFDGTHPDNNLSGIGSLYVSAEKQAKAIRYYYGLLFEDYKKYIETYSADF